LSAERFYEFLAEYRRRLIATAGQASPFFYTFKRIVLWAGL
jgi:hypothetical protein